MNDTNINDLSLENRINVYGDYGYITIDFYIDGKTFSLIREEKINRYQAELVYNCKEYLIGKRKHRDINAYSLKTAREIWDRCIEMGFEKHD